MNKDKQLEGYLKNWQEAEPFDLYKNFHRLDDSGKVAYFIRGTEFRLGEKGMEKLTTPTPNEKLSGVALSIGLSDFKREKVNFIPILELTFCPDTCQNCENCEDKTTYYYELEDVKKKRKSYWGMDDYSGSSVVSLPFVDHVRNNWIDTTSEEIADTITSQSAKGLERVLLYQIVDAGLDFFAANREYLTGLNIYPGVDLNKNSVKDISFIPVFGLKLETLSNADTSTLFQRHGFGISWKINGEDEDDELFLDYSRPCPPTCVPPPPPPPGTGG
ncbi:MAG: hypothetical protein Roseis2KO_00970 [Roseivirga sp.]